MAPTYSIAGTAFLVDGRPVNAGVRLGGAPVDGCLLGIAVGLMRDDAGAIAPLSRVPTDGLNAVMITARQVPSDASRDTGALLSFLAPALDAGLLAMIHVSTLGGIGGGPHAAIETARSAATLLASVAPGSSGIVIEPPLARRSHDADTSGAVRAARDAGKGSVLVGLVGSAGTEGALPPGMRSGGNAPRSQAAGADASASPDFNLVPWRGPRPSPPTGIRSAPPPDRPTIRLGSGRDLDDPDGDLRDAVAKRTSWFLRLGWGRRESPGEIERLEAFLETVRATRAGGRDPSDHPAVALADQRRAFRRHVGAIRSLGLKPGDAPGTAPR